MTTEEIIKNLGEHLDLIENQLVFTKNLLGMLPPDFVGLSDAHRCQREVEAWVHGIRANTGA
jgi:hypothetical protein